MDTQDHKYTKQPSLREHLSLKIKQLLCNHKWEYEIISHCGHKIPSEYSGSTWIKTCKRCGKEVYE